MYDIIIASREIALGTLDLYDPGARIGAARGTKRRGDGLFKRDDRDSGKRPHHQKDLGRPSTRVATRSAAHTFELPSLMRNPYAVLCLKHKNHPIHTTKT